MATVEVNRMLAAAAAACEDKQAEDIRILKLDPAESGLTDYFLICNGTNTRQNVAITDEIELRLKREFSTYPNSVEGRRQAEWILMDYVDFIVHVFSPEKRAFYGLERLRKSATTLSVEDLDAEIKSAILAKRPAAKRAAAVEVPAAVAKPATPKKVADKLAGKALVTKSASSKSSSSKAAGLKSASSKSASPKASSVKAESAKGAARSSKSAPAAVKPRKVAGTVARAKSASPRPGK